MSNIRNTVAAGFVALIAVWPLAGVADEATSRAVIGNTLHGHEDDGEYFDFYAATGAATSKLKGLLGDDVTHGKWTIENGNLCIDYPGDPKTCYVVQRDGALFVLTSPDGKVFRAELIAGNPQNM